jgi:hypothetical protein
MDRHQYKLNQPVKFAPLVPNLIYISSVGTFPEMNNADGQAGKET